MYRPLIAIFLLFLSSSANGQTYSNVEVTSVYDGDTFKSINIVDDDFNVLALYGNNDINHSYFLRDFDRVDFNKNGFYFSDGESDFSINDPDIKSIKLFFSHFAEDFRHDFL